MEVEEAVGHFPTMNHSKSLLKKSRELVVVAGEIQGGIPGLEAAD